MRLSEATSSRVASSSGAGASTSLSSSSRSFDRSEKLLTKFSGFLISWAMPAVSWPSEASFSDCRRRDCANWMSASAFLRSVMS